ncbi:uncharacterized protein PG986_004243 [Apiospora aurea]|uniref:Glycerophosphocholine acyltransferase 1 n=1 Tax=Apiospora aurea TaxID=335848 RepID=A0ABR1QM17_9PEZI
MKPLTQVLLPKPRSSLRQEREEWFKRVEESCAYYLNRLAELKPTIDQLCAASPSPVPDQDQIFRSYPNRRIKANEAKREHFPKTGEYGQSFEDLRDERTRLVNDVKSFEEKVKTVHAEFASRNTRESSTDDPLARDYYEFMTRCRRFETGVQLILRDADLVPATRPKHTSKGPELELDPEPEPSPAIAKESKRYKSNWMYALMCWCRGIGPGDDTLNRRGQWWQRFDWFAVVSLLLLPFLPALMAYHFSYSYTGLLVLGYHIWFCKHQLFVHSPKMWTVFWPTYYLSDLLTTGVFFSVCASHALFTFALPSLRGYAEEYTRR